MIEVFQESNKDLCLFGQKHERFCTPLRPTTPEGPAGLLFVATLPGSSMGISGLAVKCDRGFPGVKQRSVFVWPET